MTTTPRWDDERQRWERPPEKPLPDPPQAGVPVVPAAGLAAAVLLGATPGLATAEEAQPPAVADRLPGEEYEDHSSEGDLTEPPGSEPSDSSAWNGDGSGDRSPNGGDGNGGGNGVGGDDGGGTGTGGRGGGEDTDTPGTGGSSGSGGSDATDPDTPGTEDPPEEEPSPDPSTAPDTAPSLDANVWESADGGQDERVFTLIADERFEAVLTWEEGGEGDLDRVLEDRVRVPARAEEGYEEVFAAQGGDWLPGDPAFEYRYGTDPARYALATALAGDGRVVTLTLRGPAEEGDAPLKGHLSEVLRSLGQETGG
ncbi:MULTISPECIES: hypothetical protein [unclassified Nocardiopsis]|uniref:hypothetical protein n=1 Tax=Nocardiopsis TaxID=2013 RepID=UPI00387B53B6